MVNASPFCRSFCKFNCPKIHYLIKIEKKLIEPPALQYVIYDFDSFMADWGGYMGLVLGYRNINSLTPNAWIVELERFYNRKSKWVVSLALIILQMVREFCWTASCKSTMIWWEWRWSCSRHHSEAFHLHPQWSTQNPKDKNGKCKCQM